MARVNEAAGQILYEMDRFGLLSGNSKHNVTPETANADEQAVLQTAQDAATLLQNTDPLCRCPQPSWASSP